MEPNNKTKLVGQIGENLVVAELGRRKIVATAFAGNVPDIDILAYANDKTLHLQVKAWRAGSVHFDAEHFIDIGFEELGQSDRFRQKVLRKKAELDRDLIYVFVSVGESAGKDRYFMLRQHKLQTIIMDNYNAWLNKHDGVRPRNSKSTHCAVAMDSLTEFEDNWKLILDQFGMSQTS